MKQIITLIATTFILTVVNAGGKPYKTSIKINTQQTVMNISLQAAGKVNITWSAPAYETTTTIYEIQKKTAGGDFKSVAILMGESYPTYSFRDKVNSTSGTIEYRVITFENNVVINSVSQKVVVL